MEYICLKFQVGKCNYSFKTSNVKYEQEGPYLFTNFHQEESLVSGDGGWTRKGEGKVKWLSMSPLQGKI